MAVVGKEELITSIKDYIGERTDDESIVILENVSDTLESLGEDRTGEIEELKRKVKEVEDTWRKKYIERFSVSADTNKDDVIENQIDGDRITLDDIF